VESPRTSFYMPSKYGVNAQPPLETREEDLSLVLGTMQVSRGRSFSTTVTPKIQQDGHKDVARTASVGGDSTRNSTAKRKKSVPVGIQENRLVDIRCLQGI